MIQNKQLRCLLTALGISIVWNRILVLSINPRRDPSSKLDRILDGLDILGSLTYGITQTIIPGHSLPQAVVSILVSVALYTGLAWVIVLGCVWLVHKKREQNNRFFLHW
jgi:hypothetical protein